MNFDTEKFIVEIQQRESIWNCQGAIYRNRDLKRKQWEELVEIFGKNEMTTEEKRSLGKELQKKWKNIRDNFVKALKDNVSRSGSAAKKKTQYIFYNNLMFLKDTVSINETDSNMPRQENDGNETENVTDPVIPPPPKRNKKKKKEDDIGVELINVLNKNVEFRKAEEDEDRLFFLSLVSEIKKVPEHIRLRTKAKIMQVITEAQTSGYNYCNSTWDYVRPFNYNRGPHQGYQTPSFARNNNPPPPPPPPSVPPTHRGTWDEGEFVTSPESTYSQNTHMSQESDYLDLFNDNNSQ
ncbi:hypothetical protein ACJJTC_009699 [Scirpophaga incertulas]